MLKYQEIAEKIEAKIHKENLTQGTRLPNLSQLIKDYEVSKSTIVKALTILESRGVIYQVQGSGIFVRRRKRQGYINFLENQGFTADLDEFQLTSKVLDVSLIAPNEEVMRNLNCQPDDQVYHVKRVRYITGQTLCIEESFYKQSIVTYLNEAIVADSIFHYLNQALGIRIGFSDKYLSVGKLQKEAATYLSLKSGDPALFVEELFYLTSGEPFDFSKTTYHYEHSQFFLQSNSIHLS